MNRSHLALAALLGGGVALYAVAAPAPRAELTPAAFFPTAVGTKWEYRTERAIEGRPYQTYSEVEVARASVEGGNECIVTIEHVERESRRDFWEWSVSPSGLRRRLHQASPGVRTDVVQWVPFLLAPTRPGQTWTVNTRDDTGPATFTIGKWEQVRVPAGEFKALRVDVVSELRGSASKRATTLTYRFWFAQGVGIVKTLVEMDMRTEGGEKPLPYTQTIELVSFTPGGR